MASPAASTAARAALILRSSRTTSPRVAKVGLHNALSRLLTPSEIRRLNAVSVRAFSTSRTSRREDGNAGPTAAKIAASDSKGLVRPTSSLTAAELGSASNQETAGAVQLAERASQLKEEVAVDKAEAAKKKGPLTKRIWAKIKEEALHYWHGSKLLAKEVRISSRLLRRLMLGYSLTRRERRQLKRTTADLLRLIPFIPFIIIPAGELLLPVAIKIFPNMLPSTFESKFAVEEKRRGLIKVRLEMAKFLQETVREGGIRATDSIKTSDEFKEFFRKVRSTGETPSSEDVIKVARLFDEDLTLDNLTRPQLVSMCRYMQINAFGTDNYLRYQIRHKLNRIRQDDLVLSSEGMDTMSLAELQSACQNRGIATLNLTRDRLQNEMDQWIDLHLHKRISGTLLILSKAFNYVSQTKDDPSNQSQLRSLEHTLSSLPDTLLNEAELNVNKDAATNKQRLEVLQQQEELIEDEAEQEEEEAAAREADKERKAAEKKRRAKEEEEARSLLPAGETKQAEDDARMTNEQLTELGEALSLLSAKSSVLKEKEELKKLIEEVTSVESAQPEEAETAGTDSGKAEATAKPSSKAKKGEVTSSEGGKQESAESEEAPAAPAPARGLAKRVRSMLEKIDAQLDEYDRDVGSRMHIIEASPSGKISVDDLEQALRLIKHRPDDEVLEKLVDKLDVDNDGLIPLTDVLELATKESGLGILRESSETIRAEGQELKNVERSPPDTTKKGDEAAKEDKAKKPKKMRKEDIVEE